MRRTRFTFPISTLAGSTPTSILALLKQHRVAPGYFLKFALTFIAAIVFSVFRAIEKLIWGRRIDSVQLKYPPVFIIGFNRSGTTLLHTLLCQDPKAAYTTTLQTVFPYITLSQKWWLGPLANSLVPEKRPFDNVPMNMKFPQEEEFAISNLLPNSVYNFFVFPQDFDRIIEKNYDPTNMTAKERAHWKRTYRALVAKSLINTEGERYISKNPQNLPRIGLLEELYPGSHYIFLYRDPYVVVESLYNFILAIFPGIQLQPVPGTYTRQSVARFYARAMKSYFEMKANPSTPPIMEIRMEEFMKDKIKTLRTIYSFCGMDGFEELVAVFEDYLTKHPVPPHETIHIHPDTVRYVNEYALEFVDRFGYSRRQD